MEFGFWILGFLSRSESWWGARVDEWDCLENSCAGNRTASSNLAPTALKFSRESKCVQMDTVDSSDLVQTFDLAAKPRALEISFCGLN